MSDPRAIPDEERPFIPEETLPAKKNTDFDAEPASEETDSGEERHAAADPE